MRQGGLYGFRNINARSGKWSRGTHHIDIIRCNVDKISIFLKLMTLLHISDAISLHGNRKIYSTPNFTCQSTPIHVGSICSCMYFFKKPCRLCGVNTKVPNVKFSYIRFLYYEINDCTSSSMSVSICLLYFQDILFACINLLMSQYYFS